MKTLVKFGNPIKRLIALTGIMLSGSILYSQTDTVPAISTSGNIDLVSRYIWRGQLLNNSACIQPGVSATWKDFTIGAWGTYSITGAGDQETDLFISKTIGFVTVSVWDYWTFNDTDEIDYFNYRDQTTSHLFEAQILLSGGSILPFNLLASYMFYGADPSRSVYLELQYEHEFKIADLQVFAGYQAKGTGYAGHAGFVNIGCTMTRSIEISDRWALPVSLSLVTNPAARSAWLVAGITL
jgi:hypothetical protein